MSRTRLQVILSELEDQQLYELRESKTVPNRTKRRAETLRLNHRGWPTERIAEYLNCRVETVRRTIHRWQAQGMDGLSDAARSGRPAGWKASDFAVVEAHIAGPGTFNSGQVVALLESECDVHLSRRHVSRLLKKGVPLEANQSKPSAETRPCSQGTRQSRPRPAATSSH